MNPPPTSLPITSLWGCCSCMDVRFKKKNKTEKEKKEKKEKEEKEKAEKFGKYSNYVKILQLAFVITGSVLRIFTCII